MRLKSSFYFFHTASLLSQHHLVNKLSFPNDLNITFTSDLENSGTFSYNLLVLYLQAVSISTFSLPVFILDRVTSISFIPLLEKCHGIFHLFIFHGKLCVILWSAEISLDGMLTLNLYFMELCQHTSVSYKRIQPFLILQKSSST